MRAVDYLHEIAAALDDGYPADCMAHACRVAELLLAEGKQPWIARLRDERHVVSGVLHGPLTPIRLAGRQGPTWTTHYVACEGDVVYDPLTNAPIAIAEYSIAAFGRDIAIERFLDEATTADLFRRKALRAAMR
ncbi:MAG: hypothetical protein WB973_18865 [Thermoanaerobaculia bacterium]